MSGDWSANRPNKSLIGGAQEFVGLGGKSREEEVGVLSVECEDGSSKVRNMTCARDDDYYFEKQDTKKMQLVLLSHARQKFASVMRARCGVLFTVPSRLLLWTSSWSCSADSPPAVSHFPTCLC